MAVIKSGASTDQLTVDSTSKAARITLYGTDGRVVTELPTYRAADQVTATTSTASFFVMTGSVTKTVRVRAIKVTGATVTTLAIGSIQVKKYSTPPSGGSPVALTQVPVDSVLGAATITTIAKSTTAFTDGTLVGVFAQERILQKSSTIVEGANPSWTEWKFGINPEIKPIVLRGNTQYIGVSFRDAPATVATLDIEVEWTEE